MIAIILVKPFFDSHFLWYNFRMFNLSRFFKKPTEIKERTDVVTEALKVKYQAFQKLLTANNEVLEIMADMEEKLSGEYLFDMHYLKTNSMLIGYKVAKIIEHLNALSRGRYPQFSKIHDTICNEIEKVLEYKMEVPVSDLTIPVEKLGGKRDWHCWRQDRTFG